MEPDEPPRKVYDFKEREFKRDNPTGSALPPMPTAKELAMMAGPVTASGPKTAGPKPGDPNDVHVLLQENRAVEQRFGMDAIEIRKIKSRRRRDYWLMLISSEALLGWITVTGRGNPMQFVCGLAGMMLVGITLTWIMWQVMNKY